MPSLTTAIWIVALGAAVSLFLTRLARHFALRSGMVDGPDGGRKTQTGAVPVGGGAAVLVAALLALAAGAVIDPGIALALTADSQKSGALLVAAVLIALVGLADDRFNFRARYKLLGQLAAILVLVLGGDFVVHRISVLGVAIELGPLGAVVTTVWLLACVNALNLIDGMDGLLGTVGGIALVSLAVMAALTENAFAAVVALGLAGAVFGFLWWNLPPATIYMGDAGSMLIGLVIGAVAILASLKGPATVALGAPLAVLVLPMFDTTAAVVRRKLAGRGLATADRGHLHHVLQRSGLTPRVVLVVVAALGLVAAGGALASTALQNDLFALLAGGGVVVALVVGKLFGNAELRLIHKRLAAAFRGLSAHRRERPWELVVRIQGTANWDDLWGELIGVARALDLQALTLDVNAPALHESYLGRWQNPAPVRDERLWRLELPLLGGGVPIGRLSVTGRRDDRSLMDTIGTIAKIVETAEISVPGPMSPVPEVATPVPVKG